MNKTIFKFKFINMPVTVVRSALFGSIGLLVLTTALAVFFTDLTPLDALIAGLLATFLHWFGEVLHQYGHFLAAEFVDKPSTGVRVWGILGTTLYPKNEGQVLPIAHIRRAIGGPIMSFFVLNAFILLAVVFWSVSDMFRFLVAWAIFEHIAIYTVGALIPVKIGNFSSDGGTILTYWRQKQAQS